MTLSWPDVDSLGLLLSDVCLFDVLSQPVKVPPPILPIKIPCKNDLNEIFDDCSLPSHWGFSIKNPTIESEVSWSSLLSFLHFRRTEFTTDGAVTRIEFQLPHLKNFKLKQRSASRLHLLESSETSS